MEDFGDMEPVKEGSECIKGYKLLILFYNASWCLAGCGGTRQKLKENYPVWNADGQKNIQVLTITMDRTANEFATTMEDCPWPALKWGSEFKDEAMDVVDPKGTHPFLGILNGRTGKVIDEDGFTIFDVKGPDHFFKHYMSKV